MPRKPRLHVAGAIYHVISRGNNREAIFRSEEDYHEFIHHLERVKSRKAFKVYAYCLMPNHFHILLQAEETPISTIMQRLLTGYTRHFNKTYKHKGHLFQGRYKSIICERESYLMELLRYIHLNPYRAKLVQRPSEWKWSGHGEYLGSSERRIVETDEVLSHFSTGRATAVKGYMNFVRDGAWMGNRKEYYPEEKAPYLGNDAFVEELTVQHLGAISNKHPETQRKELMPLERVLENVARETGLAAGIIRGSGRARAITGARKKFICQALGAGHKAINVARFLNCSDGYITRIFSAK